MRDEEPSESTSIGGDAATSPSRKEPSSRPGAHRWASAALALVGAITIVGALAATVAIRDITIDDRPRQLRSAAPDASGTGASTVAIDDEATIRSIAARILDPDLAPDERAALVEPGGADRPDAAGVFASFDDLGASVEARPDEATISVELLGDDVAVARADIPMHSDLGPSARVRDLMFHRGGTDGWRLTYESLCGLANLAPLLGRPSSCPAAAALHHAGGLPDATSLLIGAGPDADRHAPIVLAYDSSGSVRTGRWTWLVDYPDAELGGGAPSTPAELVRVDAVSGEETGRVRLTGTQPEMATDGETLWVLEHPFDPQGNWLDPVLIAVDPEALAVRSTVPVPGDATLQAASGSAWVVAWDGVRRVRLRTDGEIDEHLQPWTGQAIAGVAPYLRSMTATRAGLWIVPTMLAAGANEPAAPAALFVDAETLELRESEVPAGLLAASGDGLWSVDDGTTTMLRHLRADGRVDATLPSPIRGGAQLWGDGHGGAWLVGDAIPAGDCCQMVDYSVTRRPIAVHLDDQGAVTDTWWSTGTTQNGSAWFTRHGDGLGWAGPDGIELLAP